jgi:F420-0:gamma-glutamyl ligase-like protein
MIHEGRFTHPDVLVQMAKTEVAELNMVMDENKHEPGTPEREIVHVWSNYINRKK